MSDNCHSSVAGHLHKRRHYMSSELENTSWNHQFGGWEILRDAPEDLLPQLPIPATGRYVVALAPPALAGGAEMQDAIRREHFALVWTNARGKEVLHELEITRCLLMGCGSDATWLPEGWTIDVIPAGWTLRHLESWFEYALILAEDDDLNNNRGDIPSRSDKSPSYLPTPRGLVTHAHLILRHLGFSGSPPEPRGQMDRAGCIAELREVRDFIRRAFVSEGQRKKRGRRRSSEPRKDQEIADTWESAKSAGTTKQQYAHDQKLSLRELNRILNRHAKRAKRARK
jgi:hypothetical protein